MMMQKISDNCFEGDNQRGAALIIAIFAILLVTVIGVAIISTGMVSQNISTNSREQTEAYYIAESGLTHATRILLVTSPSQFTAILQAGDGVANTGDELSTRPAAQTPIPATGIVFGKGYYIVKISDDAADADGNPNADSNGRIVITSIGYAQNGATATTESIVGFSGVPAMLINGNAQISGTNRFRGTMGNAHVNGNLSIGTPGMILNEQPCADGHFSASGNIATPQYARTGAGCGSQGVTRTNQEVMIVPTWNIRTSFYSRADYILGSFGGQAGKVYDNAGTMIANTSSTGNTWTMPTGQQWSWNSSRGTWTLLSTSLPNATYYTDSNLIIDADLGTSLSPARASFIAEGYIQVKKTTYFKPYLEDYGFMAGTDLQFSTKVISDPNTPSIFYSGHQVDISGHSDLVGVVIVANLADTNSPLCNCNYVNRTSSGDVKINANVTITYNGGLFDNTSKVISWREVRY